MTSSTIDKKLEITKNSKLQKLEYELEIDKNLENRLEMDKKIERGKKLEIFL